MCDLSDISILEAYNAITNGGSTNWMMLGYHDDTVISLLAYGEQGASELRDQLIDEPWYGFLRMEDRFVFIDWMPQDASNELQDRRKRHNQAVIDLVSVSPATQGLLRLTASTTHDLDDSALMTLINAQQFDDNTKDDRYIDYDKDDDNGARLHENGTKNDDIDHQPMEEQHEDIPSEEERQAAKAKEQERWEMIKQQMANAKKTNEVILVGYVSVKSDISPLWRRRHIIIQDHQLSISMDNSHRTLVKNVALDELTRYGKCDPSLDCYITNAVVLETKENEIWQLLADSRNELDMILVALDIVVSTQ